jgi:hypothetical protein
MVTNPSSLEHKESIKNEIFRTIENEKNTISQITLKTAEPKADAIIDNLFIVDNFLIFSLGSNEIIGENKSVITFGLLGQVFVLKNYDLNTNSFVQDKIPNNSEDIPEKNNEKSNEINKVENINITEEVSNELISKKITKIEFKDIDKSKKFIKLELKNGNVISYHLQKDVQEDLYELTFYLNNSTKVYNCFIHNNGYSFRNNFYFTISNWVNDKDGNCMNIFYKFSIKFDDEGPSFVIKKTFESICAG